MANIRFESFIVDADDNEHIVDIEAHYTKGWRGTYYDPPEPPECEVEKITRRDSGAVLDLDDDLSEDDLDRIVTEAYEHAERDE